MEFLILFKKLFRPIYYFFNDGKIVEMEGFSHLKNRKWIAKKEYGMAYFKGYYEPEICNYLLQNLDSASCFVDVGAHAGYFSLFAASIAKEGHVYSFEPEYNNFQFINKIITLNKIDNWTAFNKAVGANVGKIYFTAGDTTSTGKVSIAGDIEVQLTSIDVELANLEKIDLIKIDVEGFGGRVAEGAINSIRKFLPKLMIEIHEGSDELATVLTYFGDLYSFFDLNTQVPITDHKQKVYFIIGHPKS